MEWSWSGRRPLPIPTFFSEVQQLSTKKVKRLLHRTPKQRPPPRPVIRSSQLFNRIYRKAHAVSFRDAADDSLFLNKHYDESRSDLYFYQCFTVISLIGAGSFGKVFKVQSKEDGKFYAVKKSKETFKGENDRCRQLEEAKKHELLPKHPNCVLFIQAWEERCHLYIQTELCETSLAALSEQNDNISEKLIWQYLEDLLQAVKHMHDHNLVHLDIKPANIFVSSLGVCKLGDFGLVVDLSKLDSSEPMEGDPKYMAPELLNGIFTKAADIFSLGMSMLELSCDLDLPTSGEGWHQLRSGRLPSQFISHLSPDMKSVLSVMLTVDYTRRPTADQLIQGSYTCNVNKWTNTQLNVMSWLDVWRSGWRRLVDYCTPLMEWLWRWTHTAHASLSATTTPRRNFDDLDLSISDAEDDLLDEETVIRGNLEHFGNAVKLNLSDCNTDSFTEEGHKEAFMEMMRDSRLVNSTPLSRSEKKPAFSSLVKSLHLNSFDTNDVDESSSNESLRVIMNPKKLSELFDTISDDDN